MAPEADFAGQVAIVTGAGGGLGRAYAGYLAARSAHVVVNDVNESLAAQVVNAIRATGGSSFPIVASVSDPRAAEEIVSATVARFGKVDILVNNAGVGLVGRLDAMSEEDIRRAIDVHVLGMIWMTRSAMIEMLERGQGRIVNVTSGAGAFGQARMAVYSAAKAAVIGFTKALALDLVGTGVSTNAVAPIAVTGMSGQFFDRFRHLQPDRYPVEVVAPAVAYLCHRECPLNGAVLTVGGGRVARIGVFTGAGYFDPDADHDAIGERLDEVLSLDHPLEPRSVLDEFLILDI